MGSEMCIREGGIALRAGSACSSGKVGPSHVLAAMGVAENEANSAIRIILGSTNTIQDIEMFLSVWNDIYKRSKARSKDLEAA